MIRDKNVQNEIVRDENLMTAAVDIQSQHSLLAHLHHMIGAAGGHDAVDAYEEFVAALARRDVDAVLGRLSENYGRGLRKSCGKMRFNALFELWCETYPRHLCVAACFVDGDTATMETQVEVDGAPLPGRVTLVHDGATWRVDSERCADGRTRIPVTRLSPCKLT